MANDTNSPQLQIRQLGPEDEAAFIAGLAEWEGEELDWYTFAWKKGMSHEEHLQILKNEDRGENMAEGKVPHNMLYGFLNGKIIGRCSVRKTLNDFLRLRGGHIGYAVAPRFREQGFGKQLFAAGLAHLRALGEDKAMITCSNENSISRHMIENAGGEFYDQFIDPNSRETVLKFWITL